MNIQQEEFLKSIEGYAKDYPLIYVDEKLTFLSHCFWTWEEINEGLSLRTEWDVNESLIPFYGNWHDLFCLEAKTGKIVQINDDRKVIYEWDGIESFKQSLSEEEEPSNNDFSGIVDADLDF